MVAWDQSGCLRSSSPNQSIKTKEMQSDWLPKVNMSSLIAHKILRKCKEVDQLVIPPALKG